MGDGKENFGHQLRCGTDEMGELREAVFELLDNARRGQRRPFSAGAQGGFWMGDRDVFFADQSIDFFGYLKV